MTSLATFRKDSARRTALLDDEVAGLIRDTAASSRSRAQGVAKLLEQWGGRVVLAQLTGIVITMNRDWAVEREEFDRALNHAEIELEGLREDREARAAARRFHNDLSLAEALVSEVLR
jgi:hypothetical protein